MSSMRQSCLSCTSSWNVRSYKSVTIQISDGNLFDVKHYQLKHLWQIKKCEICISETVAHIRKNSSEHVTQATSCILRK